MSSGRSRGFACALVALASIAGDISCRAAHTEAGPDGGSPAGSASASVATPAPSSAPEPTAETRPGIRQQCDTLIATVNADAKRLAAASARRDTDEIDSMLAVAD